MNYYSFHIGDFRSGTANMGRLQRAIYRELIDIYYDTEKPLPLDREKLYDAIGCSESEDEQRLVEKLLRFKFEEKEDGFHHEICDRVIAEYKAKADTAKANGKLGGRPRKAESNQKEPNGFSVGCDVVIKSKPETSGSKANQEPVTTNQEPKTTEPEKRALSAVDLSIAFRSSGILTQPANPMLIELASQGVQPETVTAACEEAKAVKPGEQIGVGYVVAILKRWAADAAKVKVQGAAKPDARSSPAKQPAAHNLGDNAPVFTDPFARKS